ncbi:hypothetical protein psyc5s11_42410 [Clostridium gelidum]|uniref:Uncharacterized protein n=1 Tax=Clostridium gelidum TaxID=704125 RepID=A0ABM7TI93_9CLOT|nr:hypothetical protein [Clostridium gelidum]BCZ48174.1 hypothetical protein psyc5s11_42410 [Clostridium gelidum]
MNNIKLYIILFLVFICSSFNIEVNAITQPTSNIYKEGIYQASDLYLSQDHLYSAQNVSTDDLILQIYDENKEIQQYMKLPPSSRKLTLIPVKPNYRLVILGKGELFISID